MKTVQSKNIAMLNDFVVPNGKMETKDFGNSFYPQTDARMFKTLGNMVINNKIPPVHIKTGMGVAYKMWSLATFDKTF